MEAITKAAQAANLLAQDLIEARQTIALRQRPPGCEGLSVPDKALGVLLGDLLAKVRQVEEVLQSIM